MTPAPCPSPGTRETCTLVARQTLALPVAAGELLKLRHGGGPGVFWVTFEGHRTDHVLEAGQTLRFTGPGLVVAEALEGPARLSLRQTLRS